MLYPEAQAEAQREIDKVVGRDRLPGWSDWENLPYTRATMKEAFRCRYDPCPVWLYTSS